jgi:hypothetical protein
MQTTIDIADGKYTVVHEHGTNLHILRYGTPWREREVSGDGLILALAQEIEQLRSNLEFVVNENNQLKSQLSIKETEK